MRIFWLLFILAAISLSNGCKEAGMNQDVRIHTQTVNVVPELNPERTYHYQFNNPQPELQLLNLRQAEIPVMKGILPLNNFCMDPTGPRFTVELAVRDDRILAYGFARGDGRLSCATEFRIYLIRE